MNYEAPAPAPAPRTNWVLLAVIVGAFATMVNCQRTRQPTVIVNYTTPAPVCAADLALPVPP
jgi:hypothetical protein